MMLCRRVLMPLILLWRCWCRCCLCTCDIDTTTTIESRRHSNCTPSNLDTYNYPYSHTLSISGPIIANVYWSYWTRVRAWSWSGPDWPHSTRQCNAICVITLNNLDESLCTALAWIRPWSVWANRIDHSRFVRRGLPEWIHTHHSAMEYSRVPHWNTYQLTLCVCVSPSRIIVFWVPGTTRRWWCSYIRNHSGAHCSANWLHYIAMGKHQATLSFVQLDHECTAVNARIERWLYYLLWR